jgi:Uma2 family endonuclease
MVAVHPPRRHTRREPGPHRVTVPEYLMLASLEAWPETELLRGVIYDTGRPAESRLHALAARAVYEALKDAYLDHEVLFSGSIEAGEYSMPQPDGYVARRGPYDQVESPYSQAEDLVLVVEVSVTTLDHDLGPKLATYAEAGIPEYWVVVPRGSASYLLRHTDPSGRTFRTVERVELPEGVERLDVDAIRGT